jgi:hypothetical protein
MYTSFSSRLGACLFRNPCLIRFVNWDIQGDCRPKKSFRIPSNEVVSSINSWHLAITAAKISLSLEQSYHRQGGRMTNRHLPEQLKAPTSQFHCRRRAPARPLQTLH